MKRYTRILTTMTFLTLASSASADESFDPYFEILLLAGFSNVDATDSSVQVTTIETDTLSQNNDSWGAWSGQLGVGYVYPLFEELDTDDLQWLPMINPQLNLYYLGNGDVSGDVYQFGQPTLDHLDYDLDYNSTRLMFDLGVTLVSLEAFSIYALAGAGIAWNDVDFSAMPNIAGLNCGVSAYDLDSHSSTSFAYEFGGGITFAGTERVSISLEYLYAGFSDVELGDNTTSEFELEGSDFDVNTQTVLLGLRYAI